MNEASCSNVEDRLAAIPKWIAPLILLAIAILIRLLYYISISDFILFRILSGDSVDYFNFAKLVLNGEFLGRDILFHSSPIYPYFLTPLLSLDCSNSVIALIQLIIGASAVPLVVTLARKLSGEVAAWLAGIVYLLMAAPVFYDGELLADFLLVPGLLVMILLSSKQHLGFWGKLLLGAVTFILILAKPNFLVVAGVIALVRFVLDFRKKQKVFASLGIPLCLILGGAIAVGSSFTRNMIAVDEPVILTTSGGINFWIGNHEGASGAFSVPIVLADKLWFGAKRLATLEVGHKLGDAETQSYFYSKGIRYITGDPLGYLALVMRRNYLFVNNYEIPNHQDLMFFKSKSMVLAFLPLGWWFILPMGLAGLVVLHNREMTIIRATVIVYVLTLILLFFITGRYRYPLTGVLTAVAASFIVWIWQQRKIIRPTTWGLLGGIVSLTAVLTLLPPPEDARVPLSYSYHHLGGAYSASGDINSAVESYKEALSIDPNDSYSMNNLGLIYMKQGKFQEAVDLIGKSLSLDNSNPDAWANMGAALVGQGNLTEAEKVLQKALSMQPGHTAALTNLAVLRLQQGRVYEAKKLCSDALINDPNQPQTRRLMAYLQQLEK